MTSPHSTILTTVKEHHYAQHAVALRTELSRALLQAAVLLAGPFSDLLPRRAARERDIPGSAAAADRVRAARVDADAPDGAGGDLDRLRLRRGAPRLHRPRVLHLSACVYAEPARAALRHRSDRPDQVVDADARPLVLGLRVPQLELSPRASL